MTGKQIAIRIAVGTAIILLASALLIWGGFAFAVVEIIAMLACALEYEKLNRKCGFPVLAAILYPGIVLLHLLAWFAGLPGLLGGLVLMFFLLCAVEVSFGVRERSRIITLSTLYGLFLIGVLGAHLLLIRRLNVILDISDETLGIRILIYIVGLIVAVDSGANYFGARYGRRKLSPISPNKTIEGVLGAVFCAMVMAWILRFPCRLEISGLHALILGLLTAALGVIGDLVESLWKRLAGEKDSSRILADLGGMLDFLDSAFLIVPFIFYYILFLYPH